MEMAAKDALASPAGTNSFRRFPHSRATGDTSSTYVLLPRQPQEYPGQHGRPQQMQQRQQNHEQQVLKQQVNVSCYHEEQPFLQQKDIQNTFCALPRHSSASSQQKLSMSFPATASGTSSSSVDDMNIDTATAQHTSASATSECDSSKGFCVDHAASALEKTYVRDLPVSSCTFPPSCASSHISSSDCDTENSSGWSTFRECASSDIRVNRVSPSSLSSHNTYPVRTYLSPFPPSFTSSPPSPSCSSSSSSLCSSSLINSSSSVISSPVPLSSLPVVAAAPPFPCLPRASTTTTGDDAVVSTPAVCPLTEAADISSQRRVSCSFVAAAVFPSSSYGRSAGSSSNSNNKVAPELLHQRNKYNTTSPHPFCPFDQSAFACASVSNISSPSCLTSNSSSLSDMYIPTTAANTIAANPHGVMKCLESYSAKIQCQTVIHGAPPPSSSSSSPLGEPSSSSVAVAEFHVHRPSATTATATGVAPATGGGGEVLGSAKRSERKREEGDIYATETRSEQDDHPLPSVEIVSGRSAVGMNGRRILRRKEEAAAATAGKTSEHPAVSAVVGGGGRKHLMPSLSKGKPGGFQLEKKECVEDMQKDETATTAHFLSLKTETGGNARSSSHNNTATAAATAASGATAPGSVLAGVSSKEDDEEEEEEERKKTTQTLHGEGLRGDIKERNGGGGGGEREEEKKIGTTRKVAGSVSAFPSSLSPPEMTFVGAGKNDKKEEKEEQRNPKEEKEEKRDPKMNTLSPPKMITTAKGRRSAPPPTSAATIAIGETAQTRDDLHDHHPRVYIKSHSTLSPSPHTQDEASHSLPPAATRRKSSRLKPGGPLRWLHKTSGDELGGTAGVLLRSVVDDADAIPRGYIRYWNKRVDEEEVEELGDSEEFERMYLEQQAKQLPFRTSTTEWTVNTAAGCMVCLMAWGPIMMAISFVVGGLLGFGFAVAHDLWRMRKKQTAANKQKQKLDQLMRWADFHFATSGSQLQLIFKVIIEYQVLARLGVFSKTARSQLKLLYAFLCREDVGRCLWLYLDFFEMYYRIMTRNEIAMCALVCSVSTECCKSLRRRNPPPVLVRMMHMLEDPRVLNILQIGKTAAPALRMRQDKKLKEMDAIMYADAAKEVHRHILRGGELFDPIHVGPSYSPAADSEEEDEEGDEEEEMGGTEDEEEEEQEKEKEDKSRSPTPADLLTAPALPSPPHTPAGAPMSVAGSTATLASGSAAVASAAPAAVSSPAVVPAASSSFPPSPSLVAQAAISSTGKTEAKILSPEGAGLAVAAGVESTPFLRRFSAERGYMPQMMIRPTTTTMGIGGAGMPPDLSASLGAGPIDYYEPEVRLQSSAGVLDVPYSRSNSLQPSVLLGEGETSPVMGPLVPLEHLNVALSQPHIDEASAAAAAAAGSTESSIVAARELLLGGGRSTAALTAAAGERGGSGGPGSLAAASFIAGHPPSATSTLICPATSTAEAEAVAAGMPSHLSAVISRRASLHSEAGGPPRLFQSYQDLVNFDVVLKHQTPIGQYEFQFLDEMEAHDPSDPNWELVVDQKMIRVFKFINPNSPVVLVKAYAQVDGIPIQVLCHHIRDMPTRQKWDTTFEDYRVIEANVEHNEIIYSMMKAPFPVSNRDFLQWRRTEVDMSGGLIKILMRSAEHPSMPERPGVIRAETIISGEALLATQKYLHVYGLQIRYKMRRTEGDSSSLFILAQTDVKGLIPKWLVNTTAARAPVGWVESLRKVCLAYMKKHNGEVPAATLLSS